MALKNEREHGRQTGAWEDILKGETAESLRRLKEGSEAISLDGRWGKITAHHVMGKLWEAMKMRYLLFILEKTGNHNYLSTALVSRYIYLLIS